MFLDRKATTARILDWLARAASARASVVVFGEAFLPGYPFWLSLTDGARFDDSRQKEAYAAYFDAAVQLDGVELASIADAASRHSIFIILGIVERGVGPGSGSLYCTLYADGIGVHVALWPGSMRNTADITRFIALEGRVFTISA